MKLKAFRVKTTENSCVFAEKLLPSKTDFVLTAPLHTFVHEQFSQVQ